MCQSTFCVHVFACVMQALTARSELATREDPFFWTGTIKSKGSAQLSHWQGGYSDYLAAADQNNSFPTDSNSCGWQYAGCCLSYRGSTSSQGGSTGGFVWQGCGQLLPALCKQTQLDARSARLGGSGYFTVTFQAALGGLNGNALRGDAGRMAYFEQDWLGWLSDTLHILPGDVQSTGYTSSVTGLNITQKVTLSPYVITMTAARNSMAEFAKTTIEDLPAQFVLDYAGAVTHVRIWC